MLQTRWWRGAGSVLLAAFFTATPSTRAAQQTTNTSAQQQQPTFRVNVDLVRLDVIPRTDAGAFVSTLTKEDFEVREDGVPQQIASLTLVHGGRVFTMLQPPPPEATEGIILPAARPADTMAGRIFVLLVDDLHFTATETPLVRALLKKIMSRLFHEGDMVAMFSTGPSSIEMQMSYDLPMLQSAIGKVAGRGLSYRDIMEGRDGAQGPQGLRYNAHVAFKTAARMLRDLERVKDRRKALILVTDGYDFDPFPEGRTGKDQVFGGRYGSPLVDPTRGDLFLASEDENNRFADSDLASELAALAGAANRVNAVVYTLDPRGVMGTTTVADQVDPAEMRAHIGKTQSSLRTLAETTGGFAVVNDNGYDEALKRIDAETSDYYIIGYYASNQDPHHRNRSIEVKSRRPGIQMWSRGWYRSRGDQAPPPPKD